jgi:hypothetical protein
MRESSGGGGASLHSISVEMRQDRLWRGDDCRNGTPAIEIFFPETNVSQNFRQGREKDESGGGILCQGIHVVRTAQGSTVVMEVSKQIGTSSSRRILILTRSNETTLHGAGERREKEGEGLIGNLLVQPHNCKESSQICRRKCCLR